jgi:hypothetical protein
MEIIDTGDPGFLGRIFLPAGDKALPSLSPSANPAGIWEGIARGETDCRGGGPLLTSCLPSEE